MNSLLRWTHPAYDSEAMIPDFLLTRCNSPANSGWRGWGCDVLTGEHFFHAGDDFADAEIEAIGLAEGLDFRVCELGA